MRRRTIMLTGAAGYLGTALAERFAARREWTRVVGLAHRTTANLPKEVVVLRGDVRDAHLGLSADGLAELLASVDVIVHCAAITDFVTSRDATARVNVTGTKHILRLAERTGARFVYVSSAFRESRTEQDGAGVDASGYLDSKNRAEAHMRDSSADWMIVRPSLLTASPTRPWVAQRQGFAFLVRGLLTDRIPILPASPDSRIDFIATDLVADIVAELACLQHWPASPREWWLTAGPLAWTVDELTQAVADFRRGLGESGPFPRVIGPDVMDRLVRPVLMPALPNGVQARMRNIERLGPALFRVEPFPTSLDELRVAFGKDWSLDTAGTFLQTARTLRETRPDSEVSP